MTRLLSVLLIALLGLTTTTKAEAAPRTMADGGIFDAAFYAASYPDVAAVLGTDEAILYQHYLLAGRAEGRLPYAPGTADAAVATGVMTLPDGTLFDPVYYAQHNPDVTAVLGTDAAVLAQHYLAAGRAEGRLPSAAEQAIKTTPQVQTTPSAQTQTPQQTIQPTGGTGTYVLNTNTMKFHRPECRHVAEISARNRQDVNGVSREQVIDAGFSPCKTCNP